VQVLGVDRKVEGGASLGVNRKVVGGASFKTAKQKKVIWLQTIHIDRRNQEKLAIYQIVLMITFHRYLYPWQRILPSGTGCIHPLEQKHEDHVLLY
jgi:hypothetical protein